MEGSERGATGRDPSPVTRREPGVVCAAIDLGTNNCRMLVAQPTRSGFRVVDSFSRIVRLGEGLMRRSVLGEAAMARTIAAMRVCAAKIARNGASRVRAVATEACRRAANCERFLARVRAETGIALEIISTREEARLALAGCLPLVDAEARGAIVFDIGGGSTEIAWLHCDGPRGPTMAGATSLPCGVATLTDDLGEGAVGRTDYAAMVARVTAMIAPFEVRERIAEAINGGGVQMLGTSGTLTTIAGVHLDLARYDRRKVDGLRMSFAEVAAVLDRLVDLDYDARAAIPSIGHQRADLVIAGCAILDAICRTWPVGALRVADRGLREGMLMAMMNVPNPVFDAAAEGAAQRR